MNIGQAAKASGVSSKMIRYYETTGLIPKAERRDSGYRVYSPADVHMLRFIRRARDLGFSVAEINDLLSLWRDQSRHSADVKRIAKKHVADLHDRISAMKQMADTLKGLVDSCAGDDRPECPILADLEEPADGNELRSPTAAGLRNFSGRK